MNAHLARVLGSAPRRSKYRNVKTVVDGVTFDSAKEGRRYSELKLLERAGEISELELQPRFKLGLNGVPICEYRGDFGYRDKAGLPVVEDVKGVQTDVFKIKRKLLKALLGVDVVLT